MTNKIICCRFAFHFCFFGIDVQRANICHTYLIISARFFPSLLLLVLFSIFFVVGVHFVVLSRFANGTVYTNHETQNEQTIE